MPASSATHRVRTPCRDSVEHFFMYDQNSTDGLSAVLRPYIDNGLVTLHDAGAIAPPKYMHLPGMAPERCNKAPCTALGQELSDPQPGWPRGACRRVPHFGQQIAALRHALERHGHESEWMAWIDVDEYLTASSTRLSEGLGPLGPSIAGTLARLAASDELVGGVSLPDAVMVPQTLESTAAAELLSIESTTMAIPFASFHHECEPPAEPYSRVRCLQPEYACRPGIAWKAC